MSVRCFILNKTWKKSKMSRFIYGRGWKESLRKFITRNVRTPQLDKEIKKYVVECKWTKLVAIKPGFKSHWLIFCKLINIITTLALQSLNHEIKAKKILFCLTGVIIEPYKLKNKRNEKSVYMYEFIFVSFLTTSGVFVQFCFSQKRCILYIKFFRWKKTHWWCKVIMLYYISYNIF